ncbi:MAG: hypothetical protein KJN62_08880, partial [Deltaproteobacteria bacterium]|nr:hypothetical protein [Deltaproteobacteria bacterium]
MTPKVLEFKSPEYNFLLDVPLLEIGGGMKINIWTETNKDGKKVYCVDRAYRNAAGKSRHFCRRTTDYRKHLQNELEAAKITDSSSLTSLRFAECVKAYLKEKGTGGFNDICYRRAVESLGNLFPDRQNFSTSYNRYFARLKIGAMAKNTIRNHLVIVRTICNYAYKMGWCGNPTIRDWGIEFGESRERILTAGEELALLNTLRCLDSPILPHIMFALRNPIRKRDLFNLKRTDLKTEVVNGRVVKVVRFQAQKTRIKIRATTLVNIDTDFLRYESSLPADCQWLFPIVGTSKNGISSKLQPGAWKKVIDSDKHFGYILEKAGIVDFVFHDLKHCAETYMLRQGFTYDQMRKLGIQMSPKTQAIYDNRSAVEIAETV